MDVTGPAFVALTARGAVLAARLRDALGEGEIHGLAKRVAEPDRAFGDTAAHVAGLFAAGRPIVGICAAGILIRAVVPHLADKTAEPPVVAVAEDGSAVAPLLGGHRGANALARRIAAALGVAAAVTTAGDLAFGLALDEPPPGWRLAEVAPTKAFAAALLAGEKVRIVVEAGDADWLAALPRTEDPRSTVLVTDREIAPRPDALIYHPPVLALGVGGERGVEPNELAELARRTLAAAGLSPRAVACVASLDLKADEPAVLDLAASLGVPARFFAAARLNEEAPRLIHPSAAVLAAVGCPGVAEGAALAAAGRDSTLVAAKVKSARATCAVARSPRPIDATAVGRPRGRLTVVGIGPGSAAWRTPEASGALRRADAVVGYKLYLDLVADLIAGKPRRESDLGAEEERARAALDFAASGRDVALVSSGDAGVYGLAALVCELIDRGGDPAWRRIELAFVPGVTAMLAAAARVGAPLGHDFAAISLSDLLTPWAEIEARLAAAAKADLVVALYNPASARRRELLARALAILAVERTSDTPVVVARNLGRSGEAVETCALAELDPAQVDMLTLLIVGNRATRRVAGTGLVYTPRGYAAKRAGEAGA